MPPRVVIAAAGSLGDLHPFIALGLALKARGVEAAIASSAEYRPKIEAAGLVFHEVGPSLARLETDLGMTLAQITEAIINSDVFVFQRVVLPYLETSVRQMVAVSEGTSAVVGGTLTVGAGLSAERLGLPFVSVLLQPTLAFSAYDPPYLPKAPWLAPADRGFGLWRNRTTIALARLIAAGLGRPLNRVRARLGLPATKANIVFDAGAGADLVLGLYSPLLGTAQPDSPPGFFVTGYAPYDSETGGPAAMPTALEAFLAAGPAPIVFTLGSAAVHIPGDFYLESLKAARRLGRRAVLLVGPDGDLSVGDGPDVLALPYAPFSSLFPRAAAVVHQGGVGTTQQALRAGRPQLVVPFLGDQFDNAARIVRLGCGATLGRGRYRADRVEAVLERLLADPSVEATATRLGVVAAQEDGAAVAGERIIEMLTLSR
ncbi:nucleotide disphospho-sugar-binding domain-containing protein [Brevundimonas sp.]|uniref:glycosyltransferase n=1 Tax=Brevundimonas sp. TaxID=1871086 RepID=UPI00286BCC77|nr:nucleotide disphospho-sugar-binding domain-containing protein [Brevundimonas sp.]